jgi:hypothetical protein
MCEGGACEMDVLKIITAGGKPFTAKTAVVVMLLGKTLKNSCGHKFFWDSGKSCFRFKDDKGETHPVDNFIGLYEMEA